MLNFRPLYNLTICKTERPYLYRSGELIEINGEEVEFITSGLKIKHYIDLRTPNEIIKNGKPEQLIKAGISWVNFPIKDNNHYFRTKNNPNYYDYYDSYKELLIHNKEQYKNIFLYLSSIYQQRCIFSCFAGKDRTGILAILILLLLDFKLEEIVYDYVASGKLLLENISYFENKWTQKGLTKKQYIDRLTPDPRTATLLIEHIKESYGGVKGYLQDIGLHHDAYQEMVCNLRLHTISTTHLSNNLIF